tara:strand:+ start:473 stop:643 length:171 start_codon:yes stop_codon:yes gene_type:complete
MPTPVVHFEIHSSNAKRLNKYYTDLFGWHVNADNPMGYGMVVECPSSEIMDGSPVW